CSESTGLRPARTVEKVEARARVRLVDRAADDAFVRLHFGLVRDANSATRAVICSATVSDRFSRAVCSAATVAYSELTMSSVASEPAVASRTTIPLLI